MRRLGLLASAGGCVDLACTAPDSSCALNASPVVWRQLAGDGWSFAPAPFQETAYGKQQRCSMRMPAGPRLHRLPCMLLLHSMLCYAARQQGQPAASYIATCTQPHAFASRADGSKHCPPGIRWAPACGQISDAGAGQRRLAGTRPLPGCGTPRVAASRWHHATLRTP